MLVKTNGYDVSGNMPGDAMDMSLSSDSLEHIMDILSDLYSNRPAAIVREYGTNAMDSHIISGQVKPIEIQTPSRLNPNLVIRDFGEGMSKQVLIDTYSKYGASTKRGNNLEAGQLGLGSKSGFAYTDQFTVRSVNNGHCCELIMSRNDRGAAEMTIAVDYATDDPSGVTITIPIKSFDVELVISEVQDFATYATPGTVSVNGKINEIPEHWEKIADNLYCSSEISHHMIVMGNVAYPAKIFDNIWMPYRAKRIIAFVGMGEVDFVPSRENLKYTLHTQRTILNIEQYLLDSITEQAKDLIENADTIRSKIQAYKLVRQWDRYFPNGIVAIDFREEIEEAVGNSKFFRSKMPHDISDRHDRIYNEHHEVLTFDKIAHIIDSDRTVVTGFPSDRVSRDQARKILAMKPNLAGQSVLMFEEENEVIKDIFTDWTFLSWEDFKSVRVARPRNSKPKNKTQEGDLYLADLVHHRKMGYNPRMMKVTGPSYYCSQSELNEMSTQSFPREDFKLFIVIPSRQAAFAKKNPHAKSLKDYVRTRQIQIRNHINGSDNIMKALEYSHSPIQIRRSVQVGKITNQDFLSKIRLAQTGHKWAALGERYYGGRAFSEYISKNYPLVRLYSYNSALEQEHMTDYINMIGEKNVGN